MGFLEGLAERQIELNDKTLEVKDPWKWAEETFQALAYWHGYQTRRFRHYPIREIAVVSELAALLHGLARSRSLYLECEKTFPEILDRLPARVDALYRQKRVDIALAKNDYDHPRTTHVMEVKVARDFGTVTRQALCQDLIRLRWLMTQSSTLAVRLLILTDQPLPKDWLTDSGRSVRSAQRMGTDGPDFHIRRVLRALPCLPKRDGSGRVNLNRGPSVLLLEPIVSTPLINCDVQPDC